jgi:hypothetical protein
VFGEAPPLPPAPPPITPPLIPPAVPPKAGVPLMGCANAGGAAPKPPVAELVVGALPKAPDIAPVAPLLAFWFWLPVAPNIGAGPLIGAAPNPPMPVVAVLPKALLPPLAAKRLLLLLLLLMPLLEFMPVPPKGDGAIALVVVDVAAVPPTPGKPPPPSAAEGCPLEVLEAAPPLPNGLGAAADVVGTLVLPPPPNANVLDAGANVGTAPPAEATFPKPPLPSVDELALGLLLLPPLLLLLLLLLEAAEEKEKPPVAGAAVLFMPVVPAMLPKEEGLNALKGAVEAPAAVFGVAPFVAAVPVVLPPKEKPDIVGAADGAVVDAVVDAPPKPKAGGAVFVAGGCVAGALTDVPLKAEGFIPPSLPLPPPPAVDGKLPTIPKAVLGSGFGASVSAAGAATLLGLVVPLLLVAAVVLPRKEKGLLPPLLLAAVLLLLSAEDEETVVVAAEEPEAPAPNAGAFAAALNDDSGAAAAAKPPAVTSLPSDGFVLKGLAMPLPLSLLLEAPKKNPDDDAAVVVGAGVGDPLPVDAEAGAAPNGFADGVSGTVLALFDVVVVAPLVAPKPPKPPLLLLPPPAGLKGVGEAEEDVAGAPVVGAACCVGNADSRPSKLATSRRHASMLSWHDFSAPLSAFTLSFSTFSSVSSRLSSIPFFSSASCIFSRVESNFMLYCAFTSSSFRVSSSMRASKRLSMCSSRSVKILISCCWLRSMSCDSLKPRLMTCRFDSSRRRGPLTARSSLDSPERSCWLLSWSDVSSPSLWWKLDCLCE